MVIAGIGCRRGCDADSIAGAVHAACKQAGRTADALATAFFKAEEAGLREAAVRLGLKLILVGAQDLHDAQARCGSSSAPAARATGFASVGEASALATAGPRAHLLVRVVQGGVVCALAAAP